MFLKSKWRWTAVQTLVDDFPTSPQSKMPQELTQLIWHQSRRQVLLHGAHAPLGSSSNVALSLRRRKERRREREGAELHRKRRRRARDGDSMLYAQKSSLIIVHWVGERGRKGRW